MARILIADDDRTVRRNLKKLLESEGFATLEARDGQEALNLVKSEAPDALLLDLKMPQLDGLAVLEALKDQLADLPVIVVTAFGGSGPAIEAIRLGAYDYLTKPFDLDEVLLTLRRALRQRELAAEVRALKDGSGESLDTVEGEDSALPTSEIIGSSSAMREVFKAIGRAAATEEPVLIVGESGTGKELVAQALHQHSNRSGGPFIRVNCAALPEGLIESELFGHERGAFTGAERLHRGRFERARSGTIFLDEVAELPLSAQAKLLRVLQHQEFERVGGNQILTSDARVVSATLHDLGHEVSAGKFRDDLFYRLNVVRISIPPLRERVEDLPALTAHILQGLEKKYGWHGLSLAPEALLLISASQWPGNVRQLQNALARAAIAARGKVILPEHLEQNAPDRAAAGLLEESNQIVPLRALLAEVEQRAIWQALKACNGNRTRTAEQLGISRRQLFDKIREYDIS